MNVSARIQVDRARFALMLHLPNRIDVTVTGGQVVRSLDLFDLLIIRELQDYQTDAIAPLMRRRIVEIEYAAQFDAGRSGMLRGNTYLLLPEALLSEPATTVLQTHLTGSMRGLDEFLSKEALANDDTWRSRSIEAMSVFFHSYYMHLPIHIICKGGPDVKVNFENATEDLLARRWMRAASEMRAAADWLISQGIPIDPDRRFVGGISRGGFDALLLAAFDDSISHVFSVAGCATFAEWTGVKGGHQCPEYDRPGLIEQNIETADIFALSRARTQVLFAMTDREIRPTHFPWLNRINTIRAERYDRQPFELKIFHPEPGRRGHCWPRVEALNFFANAMWQ